jgi:hypothetical protein
MDYIRLLLEGAKVLLGKEFRLLLDEVVEWLVEKRLIGEADVHSANEALEDIINIHVSTGGFEEIRKEIIISARTSSQPNQACLRGIRKAVYREIRRGRYVEHQHRLYRQVKLSVLDLERKGVLQSRTRNKRLKRVGLSSWGASWLDRVPEMNLHEVDPHLPMIPCYEGESTNLLETDRGKEPKIFDYNLLESFIPELCATYGGSLTIGEIAGVVERKLSRPLFRLGNRKSLPEDEEPEADFTKPSDLLACSQFSWEEELLSNDVVAKLEPDLTPEELQIMKGLADGMSKRKLAEMCGCAPNTIESWRQALQEKAARLDPVIKARMEYLQRQALSQDKTFGKKGHTAQ